MRTGHLMPETQNHETGLMQELVALRAEIRRLNQNRYVRLYNSPMRLLGFQFARGLAFGLGSVLGATVLVSIAVYILSGIDFLPIIGDWASEIARQIQEPK